MGELLGGAGIRAATVRERNRERRLVRRRITFRYHLSTNPYVPFAFAPLHPLQTVTNLIKAAAIPPIRRAATDLDIS